MDALFHLYQNNMAPLDHAYLIGRLNVLIDSWQKQMLTTQSKPQMIFQVFITLLFPLITASSQIVRCILYCCVTL